MPLSMWPIPLTSPDPAINYIFDRQNLELPLYLQAVIVGEDRNAFYHARRAASVALRQLKTMQRRRTYRFNALCPRTNGSIYYQHTESLKRLWAWRDDFIIGNATLAPEPKIPGQGMILCADRAAYNEFSREYFAHLQEYMMGVYRTWRIAKMELEETIAQSPNISNMDWHMWQSFYRHCFLREMEQWEKWVTRLPLPTFDALVEQVCWAVRERVEDGARLAEELRTRGTTAIRQVSFV